MKKNVKDSQNTQTQASFGVDISIRQNADRTSLDFPGYLLLVFVEILPDKVILDHEKSYLVSFEIFHFFQF